jgi:hypothetical protein
LGFCHPVLRSQDQIEPEIGEEADLYSKQSAEKAANSGQSCVVGLTDIAGVRRCQQMQGTSFWGLTHASHGQLRKKTILRTRERDYLFPSATP